MGREKNLDRYIIFNVPLRNFYVHPYLAIPFLLPLYCSSPSLLSLSLFFSPSLYMPLSLPHVLFRPLLLSSTPLPIHEVEV